MSRRRRLSADVGGTFTDLVAVAPDGTASIGKVPTTRDGALAGIAAALDAVAEQTKRSAADLPRRRTRVRGLDDAGDERDPRRHDGSHGVARDGRVPGRRGRERS